MKNLPKNKKLLVGVGVMVLLVVILLASGILKFKVTRTLEGPEQVLEPTRRIGQKAELVSKETTFEAVDGKVKLSIRLPLGWSVTSYQNFDFVAGSLIKDKLADGKTEFTANLLATVDPHPAGAASFAKYESSYRDEIFKKYPSMEEVTSYSTKVNGMDTLVLEVRNTRPDGLVVHQLSYVYFLNDKYYMDMTISAAEETWEKYSSVANDSLKTVKLVTVL